MTKLKFLTKSCGKISSLADFWHLDEHNIPAKPGVYLLVARPGVDFLYPKGRSPVYYIGQTQSLRRRLSGHLKWHNEVRFDCRHGYSISEPRHEYGGVFGGRYCYIETRRGQTAKSLEDFVLAEFAKCFHSFPVANSAGAWKHID